MTILQPPSETSGPVPASPAAPVATTGGAPGAAPGGGFSVNLNPRTLGAALVFALFGAGGDVGRAAFSCLAAVGASSVLNIYVNTDGAGADSVTPYSASLSFVRVDL